MNSLLHAGAMLAICAGIAGCAVTGATSKTSASATTVPAKAKDAVVAGKSTKADVIAALGKTTVVHFDSGFEVWVYQLADVAREGAQARGNSEFVVLFDPSGVVTKIRTRHAPAPG